MKKQMSLGKGFGRLLLMASVVCTMLLAIHPVANAAVQQRTVVGNVVDNDGAPMPGVNVVIKGTTTGVATDFNGQYSINVPNSNAVLVFSYISYHSQEVTVGDRTTVNVTLEENIAEIEEVVVTALGIKRAEKALGYSIGQLNEDAVTNARSANVMNSLSGKISGVNVRAASGDPGSTVLINIRGQRSLTGDNQPLIVLDGIPVNNSVKNTKAQIGSEGTRQTVDYGNPISDINPDDIASISVLKGAAAAALYGGRAGNGVILITTKSGASQKKGIGVSFNTSVAFDKAWQFPKFQNTFGSGSREGTDDVISDASWGPRLDNGSKYVQWDSPTDPVTGEKIPTDWVSYPNRVKDFFNTGHTIITNVAVNGANDKGDFRISYTNMENKGIVPNTDLSRNNINFTAGYKLHKNLKVSTNIAYAGNKSDNRPSVNRESVVNIVYTMPANIDVSKLKDYWMPGLEGIKQNSPVPGGNDNPYFVANEALNGFNRDRMTGNVQVVWDILPDLSLMGRTGLDYYNEDRESRQAYSARRYPQGAYLTAHSYFMEQNTDFLLSYKKDLTSDWFVSVSVGANRMDSHWNSSLMSTTKLATPGVYNISNAAAGTVQTSGNFENGKWKKRINSIYAMGQVAFRNYAFLDLTARNDWSSTLPDGNNSYFYPSASLSFLLSDMLHMSNNGAISFIKLRGNISQVGTDVGPYDLYNTVTMESWGSQNIVKQGETLQNNQLKPEISTSYEVGTDLRFLAGRLGFDFTWYKTNIVNQVMSISTTWASGYGSRKINAGEIQNKGIEFTLRGTPIDSELRWDISATFSRNRNKIVELTGGVTQISMYGAEGVEFYAREGEEIGDFYSRSWRKVPSGPYAGEPWLNDGGGYERENEYIKIGNYNPDFMIGFVNTFTYKGFTLNALIDWRQGGQFYSYVAKNLLSDGRTEVTVPGRDAATGGLPWVDGNGNSRNDGMIVQGYIQQADGSYAANTLKTDPEDYYGEYYWSWNERSTFDASYVKLREVSLDYTFGKNVLNRLPFTNITIGVFGRNLFSWTAADQGFDPETSMTFTQDRIAPGVGSWALPYTRTYGFKIGFNF